MGLLRLRHRLAQTTEPAPGPTARTAAGTAAGAAAEPCGCQQRREAELDRLRAELGRVTSELYRAQLAVADRERERAELVRENRELSAQLRQAVRNEDRAAAHWRRLYEQQRSTNALLDDRLARAEGRPTFGP